MNTQDSESVSKTRGSSKLHKMVSVGTALSWAALLSVFSGAGAIFLAPYINPQPKLLLHAGFNNPPRDIGLGRKSYGPLIAIGDSGTAPFDDITISIEITKLGQGELKTYGHTAFVNATLLEDRIKEGWIRMNENTGDYRLSIPSLNPEESFNRDFHMSQPTQVAVEVRALGFFHKQHFEYFGHY